MKAYGLPRYTAAEFCDRADLAAYARKSSVGDLPGKGGDTRSHTKSSAAKRAVRRTFKRAARAEGKVACRVERLAA